MTKFQTSTITTRYCCKQHGFQEITSPSRVGGTKQSDECCFVVIRLVGRDLCTCMHYGTWAVSRMQALHFAPGQSLSNPGSGVISVYISHCEPVATASQQQNQHTGRTWWFSLPKVGSGIPVACSDAAPLITVSRSADACA